MPRLPWECLMHTTWQAPHRCSLTTTAPAALCPRQEYLEEEVVRFSTRPNRPVYILGESFGGILALAVAAASRRATGPYSCLCRKGIVVLK